MRVGVLGSSDVGQALGRGFAGRGHDVKLGSRTPKSEALTTWLKEVKGKASTGTFEEAARHGETIVIATRGFAFDEVARLAGPKNFVGDRKSTRLNSSHANISYAVFCLKKKKKHQ